MDTPASASLPTAMKAEGAAPKSTDVVQGQKVERIPLKTGPLQLLTGIFKVPSKRTVTLWPDKLEFSLASSKTVGVIYTHHAMVIKASGNGAKKKLVVVDRQRDEKFTFVAASEETVLEWTKSIQRAVKARLAARQAALDNEKARMEAIAKRLGVGIVGVKKTSQDGKPPTIAEIDPKTAREALKDSQKKEKSETNEDGAGTADGATDVGHSATGQTSQTGRLSQEALNAANACGIDPANIVVGVPAEEEGGSGRGNVRLQGEVYWYEVTPSDTLSGVCLRFDADESHVRRANYLSKRNIDGIRVLRIPRNITGDPTFDYSSSGNGRLPTVRKVEDPEVRRQRQEKFQVHIMMLLSAQRALRTEDCFTANESRAYLKLHNHDLNAALDAMSQDTEWDEKYGHILRSRAERVERQLAMQGEEGGGLGRVVAEAMMIPHTAETGPPQTYEMQPLAAASH